MLGERDGGRYDHECPPGPGDDNPRATIYEAIRRAGHTLQALATAAEDGRLQDAAEHVALMRNYMQALWLELEAEGAHVGERCGYRTDGEDWHEWYRHEQDPPHEPYLLSVQTRAGMVHIVSGRATSHSPNARLINDAEQEDICLGGDDLGWLLRVLPQALMWRETPKLSEADTEPPASLAADTEPVLSAERDNREAGERTGR